MTEYEFVCHECGRTFKGLTSHVGEEMCPECGSSDIEPAEAPSPGAATADHDSPEASTASTPT